MTRSIVGIGLLCAVILWLLLRKGPPLATVAVRGLYRIASAAHSIAFSADYALHAFRKHREMRKIELVSDEQSALVRPPQAPGALEFPANWRN